jgi:hypothetical protein
LSKRELHVQFVLGALGGIRQHLEHVEALGTVRHRFHISRSRIATLARPLPVAYRLLGEAGLSAVIRQQFRPDFGRLRKPLS